MKSYKPINIYPMWKAPEPTSSTPLLEKKIVEIRRILSLAIKRELYNDLHLSKLKHEEDQQEEEVIKDLKKGYLMTKHSNKCQSKSKFVYLSMNERFLCWKSVDKQDQKRIEINKIIRIVREGQEYINDDKKIRDTRNCIVIITEERTLVLQAVDITESHLFEDDLERAMKHCFKMSLNYHYLND